MVICTKILEQIKEKELVNAKKQLLIYQKEAVSLRVRVSKETGFDKVIELDTKLKESITEAARLKGEIKKKKDIQRNQGKELERIIQNAEYENKIKFLSDDLNNLKLHAKELYVRSSKDNTKFKDYVQNLEERYHKAQSTRNKPCTSHNSIPITKDLPKSEIIVPLKSNIESLRSEIEKERVKQKKEKMMIIEEIERLKKEWKSVGQVNRVNALKLKDLSKIMSNTPLRLREINSEKKPLFSKRRNTTTLRTRISLKNQRSNKLVMLISNLS